MSPHSNYRPDIDGLRAVAVLAVVLFHMGGVPVSGGFVGVDIFFVISGYLISSAIFSQLDSGKFSLVSFYERRFRRLQPALIVVVMATGVAMSWLMTPIDYKAFAQSVGSTMLFVSNVLFYLKVDYFDPSSDTKPLLHTWSLAVEEQYYLIFPLLAMAAYRWCRSYLTHLLLLLTAASLAWSSLGGANHPDAVFYLPFSRVWELLIGVLLVRWRSFVPESPVVRDTLAFLGLACIAWSIFTFQAFSGYPGWQALVPCLGTALVIAAGERGIGRVSKLLTFRPMVFIGAISYSMYLWHWPILAGLRYVLFRELSGGEAALYLVLLLLLSWASWRWIEQPVRGMGTGPAWSRAAVFRLSFVSITVGLAFAGAIQWSAGWPGRWPESAQRYAAAALDTNPMRARCDRPSPEAIVAGQLCTIGDARQAPSFVVIGDSFGDALIPGFDLAAKEQGRAGLVLTHSGCFPLIGIRQKESQCVAFSKALADYLDRNRHIKNVFLVSRWTSALLGTRYGQMMGEGIFITDDHSDVASYDENRRVFKRALQTTLDALADRRVSLVAFIPEQRYDIPRALSLVDRLYLPMSVELPAELHQKRQSELRAVLNQAVAARSGQVRLIDVGAELCDAHHCRVQADGLALYADDNHLSRTGAQFVRQLFVTALMEP